MYIYSWLVETTKSIELAKKIPEKIIVKTNEIHYTEQYPMDEILGYPYRKVIVGHYKIVFKPTDSDKALILRIFDSRQSPNKYSLKSQ